MALLGKAAVAMWWNVSEDHLGEFNEWHSKEHLPERLGIPGFNRGSRWQGENSGAFFVIYELATYETLVAPAYLERLNNPTPWSKAMMPLHRDMVRSQCRVLASYEMCIRDSRWAAASSSSSGQAMSAARRPIRRGRCGYRIHGTPVP